MPNPTKPTKNEIPGKPTETIVNKDKTELSEDELKKISGGPTAVEMPGRVTN